MTRDNFPCVVRESSFPLLGETEAHPVVSQSQGKGAWEAGGESKVSWAENCVFPGLVLCQSGMAQFCFLAKNTQKSLKYGNL